MGILVVLMILTFGYLYASSDPVEKVKLKRSVGYASYAHLAVLGLGIIAQGFLISFAFILVFYITGWILDFFIAFFSVEFRFVNLLSKLLYKYQFGNLNIKGWHCLLVFCSWIACSEKINKKANEADFESLKTQDSILNLTIDAFERQVPVKISLKSKKVYVGLIYSEQFEQVDLDNIVIIPMLSGYRNKDTLAIHFDCNYSVVYEKNGLLGADDEYQLLSNFRIVFRMSEIESISYFDFDFLGDFEHVDISHEKTSTDEN